MLKAPASITVLTAENFSGRNITRANELTGIIPGLVQTNGNGSLPATTFRGLGSNSSVVSAEPSVSSFVDGVYYGHLRDATSPMYDIDHIEFIKGTQATLLGKNTSVGAISVLNRRPTDKYEFEFRYTHSFEIDGNRGEGYVNLPLAPNFQLRAAFLASHDTGYVRNEFRNRNEPHVRDLSGRLSLAWQPTDGIDATLIYQHDDRDQTGFQWEVPQDPRGIVAGWAAKFGQVLNTRPDRISGTGSRALGGTIAGPEQFEKQVTNRVNLIVTADVGAHVLTFQSAWHKWHAPRYTETDGTGANLFGLQEDEHNEAFTQEIRLNSPTDTRLQYLAGLYYYWNHWWNPVITGGSPANTVGFPLTGTSNTIPDQKTEAFSAFASATYELFENFKVDGGLRYTHETKNATMQRVSSGTIVSAFPPIPFYRFEKQVAQPVDYSVGVRYEPDPAWLLYASFSKGSKSGGFQESAAVPAAAPYTPEKAYTAEIGAKLGLGAGNFVALAVFNTKVDGFQANYTATLAGVSRVLIGNANIRSRGFEASGSYRLLPQLRLGGSVVYADGQYTDPFPGDGSVARKGDPLSRNPKWSGRLTADYSEAISDVYTLFGGTSFDFASKSILQSLVTQPNAPFQASHQTIDARIGMRSTRGWEVALLGTNLTNETYVTFATGISASGGAYIGSVNRGRVLALQLTIR